LRLRALEASANDAWVICVSSARNFGVQGNGRLFVREKKIKHKETREDDDESLNSHLDELS